MTKLWKSNLNSGLHPALFSLNQSLTFDIRLLPFEIQGSCAHVEMLVTTKLISPELAKHLIKTLNEILKEYTVGNLSPASSDEDVHSFVERILVEKIGDIASNIHIGRSRNEQVLLDTSLFLRHETTLLISQLKTCCEVLRKKSEEAASHYMPSYTHLRRAQPIFVRQMWDAHHVLWQHAISRFEQLLVELHDVCPIGAGASNGTTLATEPSYEARTLSFTRSPLNSVATLSSRSTILSFAAGASHWLLDVSRLMEDIVVWSTSEFGFVRFDNNVTTGSSMMPQKRNPDICEIIRAKSAVAIGHYVTLMTLLKGLPMGYMKDLQEDKPALFAIVDTAKEVANALPYLLEGINFDFKATEAAASDPLLLATDVMEWLVHHGVPLRDAHHRVANCIHESHLTGVSFPDNAKKLWPDLPMELFDPLKSCQKRARCQL